MAEGRAVETLPIHVLRSSRRLTSIRSSEAVLLSIVPIQNSIQVVLLAARPSVSPFLFFFLRFTSLAMSSGAPSFTLPPTANVLLASPSLGPTVCTASLRLPITASPARSVSPVRSLPLPFEAPFTVQTSLVHSGIEILPQPPRSSVVAVPTAPLACAPSLTERALRSQRRDALRALHDVAVTSSPSPVRLHDTSLADSGFGAQTANSQMQPLTPRRETPAHNYSNSAPAPRATIHVANHPPFTVRVTPSVFSHPLLLCEPPVVPCLPSRLQLQHLLR